MLKPVEEGPSVVACNTCRRSHDTDAVAGGGRLVAALRAIQAGDDRYAGIAVQEMPCLFACTASCAIHLRAPGKIGYVMGGFTPDIDAARAILDYAVHFVASGDGEVPFEQWPEGVKGRFITRTPPPGYVVE
jgi:predicted metal-binding protein